MLKFLGELESSGCRSAQGLRVSPASKSRGGEVQCCVLNSREVCAWHVFTKQTGITCMCFRVDFLARVRCLGLMAALASACASLGCGGERTAPVPAPAHNEVGSDPQGSDESWTRRPEDAPCDMWRRTLPARDRAASHATNLVVIGDDRLDTERSARLDGIELPPSPTDAQVRAFVSRVLSSARGSHSRIMPGGPEQALLATVGPKYLYVLLEPLVCDPITPGRDCLLGTVRLLIDERNKQLVLNHLAAVTALLPVVIDCGWEQDARQVILERLGDEAGSVSGAWVAAAARLAGPEHMRHLRRHLRGAAGYRYTIWSALQKIKGVGSLDDIVRDFWRETVESGARGHSRLDAAYVAVHYGHVSALEVVASAMRDNRERAWTIFSRLTGFGDGMGLFSGREEKGWLWFKQHREKLQFDIDRARYVVAGN